MALSLHEGLAGSDGTLHTTYRFCPIKDVMARSRRHANGQSTQGTSKLLQSIAHPRVVKLDFQKCFATLAPQAMGRLRLHEIHATIGGGTALVNFLQSPDSDDKKLEALYIFFGRKPNENSLVDMQSASRLQRWAADSCLPDMYEAALADDRPSPESICLSKLLEGIEDACTEALVQFVIRASGDKLAHLLREFDAIGVNPEAAGCDLEGQAVSPLLLQEENYIATETGYHLRVVDQKEQCLLVALKRGGTPLDPSRNVFLAEDVRSYGSLGNGIQLCLQWSTQRRPRLRRRSLVCERIAPWPTTSM